MSTIGKKTDLLAFVVQERVTLPPNVPARNKTFGGCPVEQSTSPLG
jgi:hypothetical protein